MQLQIQLNKIVQYQIALLLCAKGWFYNKYKTFLRSQSFSRLEEEMGHNSWKKGNTLFESTISRCKILWDDIYKPFNISRNSENLPRKYFYWAKSVDKGFALNEGPRTNCFDSMLLLKPTRPQMVSIYESNNLKCTSTFLNQRTQYFSSQGVKKSTKFERLKNKA